MKRIPLFILVFILGVCGAYSQNFSWSPEPVAIKNGTNNTIHDICYGKDGFVWLATDQGITRYDGFHFRDHPLVFSTDHLSRPLYQAVKSLKESSDGLFYIQLYLGGIICFDKEQEKYLPVRFNRSVGLRSILDFCWNDGFLYLVTSDGLFRARVVRKKEKETTDFVFCTMEAEPLVKGKIANLCADGKRNLFFTQGGKKVICYGIADKKTSLIGEYGAVSRLFLTNGYLWIDRLWNDLICYDLKRHSDRIIPIRTVGHCDFSGLYVTKLICKDKQTFFVTTWDGLFRLDFDNEKLCESPYSLDLVVTDVEPFYSNIERKMTGALWDDQQKILWVSTFGGGLVKFDISEQIYRVQQELRARINGMVEDAQGYVWLMMSNGTLMKSVSPSLSSRTHFEEWKGAALFDGHNRIYKDRNGYIWLGNNHGTVVRLNPLTDEAVTFSLVTEKGERWDTSISQFCMDSRNRLWVATSGGLALVDPQTRRCRKIEPPGKALGGVFTIAEDKEGSIWIGTSKGVKRLEYSDTDSHAHWKEGYEKGCGLEEMPVQLLYVNNSNQIYVAYSNVVARIDEKDIDRIKTVYTLNHGLISGYVSCMVDDQIGNTWAGGNIGIGIIKNGQSNFYNYLSVGNCISGCRLNDGRLLWTDSWTLLFFDPAVFKSQSGRKKLMLTGVEMNGKAVLAGEKWNGQKILSVSPEKQNSLVFNSKNHDFSLYFSDLHYGMLQRKLSYRLLPEESEWQTKLLGQDLSYSKLPIGEYLLQVKLVYPDAKESEVMQIPIRIKPDWYRSRWAYWCYGGMLFLLLAWGYSFMSRRKRRNRLERDRELLLRNTLSREKMKQERKQEMETLQNRLLAVFVKELRTPLSLIIAPLKEMLEDHAIFENFLQRGQIAYRNSLRMLDTCNQLLAVYEYGNLDEKLAVAPYQVGKLVEDKLFDIRELFKVYPIQFHYDRRIKKDTVVYVDRKKMEFIIHNLLTNALTHTKYAGKVSLTVCETLCEQTPCVSLTVEDDAKVQVKTRDLCLSDELFGDGMVMVEVGYVIMKQIVEMHHGTIQIESSVDKGTKVIVNLPLDRAVLESDPNLSFVEPEEQEESESQRTVEIGFASDKTSAVVLEDTGLPAFSESRKTLLIVEDQKDIRLYLKVLFSKEYNLLMATNGQEGIDMAVKELPDLIICDVMMPVKDGFECCREIKEGLETCGIPIIMLTARVEEEDIIRGLDLGADDYLLKPFVCGVLKAKVRNLINGRLALKQMYTKLFMLPGTDAMEMGEADLEDGNVTVEDSFISSVIKIVEDNICKEDFSVKKLAAEMNMSQPTLYRKVKMKTDYTIIELVRGVRMRRAAVLLKTKQYAVQEVAEMVGYNDIPTFRKHFVDTAFSFKL